jgi:hypothetical protein
MRARSGHLVDEPPILRGRRINALGQDHQPLGRRRADQRDHARHRLAARVHSALDLGRVEPSILSRYPQVEGDRQRDAASDAPALDCAQGERTDRV